MTIKDCILILSVLIAAPWASAGDTKWDIRQRQEKDMRDTIEVFSHKKGKAKLLLKVSSEKFGRIVDYEVVHVPSWNRNILVTVWTWGSASQVIKIFDPTKKTKKLLCTYHSEAPPQVHVKSGKLVFWVPNPGDQRPDPDFIDRVVDEKLLSSRDCRGGGGR